jgi:ATP/maltotriose-dependent transcriptional regulator MalT
VELAQGKLAPALHWADSSGLSSEEDDLSYPREGEYLTLARVRIAQARDDPASPLLRDVLRLLLEGASNREIAHRLVLSVNTVKRHVYNLCGKMGVQSRAQAIVRARALHFL